MKLCIDAGNSFVKMMAYHQQTEHDVLHAAYDEVEKMKHYLTTYGPVEAAIVSRVRELPESFEKMIRSIPVVHFLSHTTKIPFVNQYLTPETLGRDRIAGLAAAAARFPGKNVLVIDMGTCITYDLLRSDAVYEGGMISPGLQMRFKAMHAFTERLPLVVLQPDAALVGGTTHQSMQSGVWNGLLGEIEQIVQRFKSNYEDLTVMTGGGDNIYFDNKFSFSIFAAPNLVLEGLKVILDFNERQHIETNS